MFYILNVIAPTNYGRKWPTLNTKQSDSERQSNFRSCGKTHH